MKFIWDNLDIQIIEAIRPQSNPLLNVIVNNISYLAIGGFCFWVLAAILWMRGSKLIAKRLALSITLALIATEVMKQLFHRARPLAAIASLHYLKSPDWMLEPYSFPSGHTSTTAAAAFVIFYYYKGWRGWLAVVFAILIGIIRVYQGMHYPSDVITGFILGLLAAKLTGRLVRKPTEETPPRKA